MKILLTLFCISLYLPYSISQAYTTEKGDTHLWGEIKHDQLKESPYSAWVNLNSASYDSKLNTEDGAVFKDVKVKAFIGTWCGDTKYLLPKFIKTWSSLGLDEKNLEIIGLHHEGELYKQGPKGETLNANIHKVPTFVFERNGEEIGRIVERTVFDLDEDMMLIAEGKPYKHRYQGVAIMDDFLAKHDDEFFQTEEAINSAYRLVRREVSKYSELNIYGYILKYQGELEKALFIYKLNQEIFPYEPGVISAQASLLQKMGRLDEAEEKYYEALRIMKTDDRIIEKLAEIRKEKSDKNSD